MVDSCISWTEHVDTLSKRVSSRIGLMSRIKNYLDSSTSKLIYNAIVLPLLDYYDIVWDCCNASSKAKLQSLQNRACKVILKSEPPQSKWLTLEERRRFHKAIVMYKCFTVLSILKYTTTILEERTFLQFLNQKPSN